MFRKLPTAIQDPPEVALMLSAEDRRTRALSAGIRVPERTLISACQAPCRSSSVFFSQSPRKKVSPETETRLRNPAKHREQEMPHDITP